MLVGHLAVGFVAKRIEPKVSLGTFVLAALLTLAWYNNIAGPIRATVNEKLNWQILGAAVVPDAHVPATKVPNIHQWMGKQRDHDLGKFESSQVLI